MDALKPFKDAPVEIQEIIKNVIEHEKKELHRPRPRGIKEDIVEIIKKEIR